MAARPDLLAAAVVLAGCVAAFLAWRRAPAWFGLVLLVALLAIAVVLPARVLARRAAALVVTNERVIVRHGLLRRVGRELSLDRIEEVHYTQHLIERLVGVGTLYVCSVGDRPAEVFEVADPEGVKSVVGRAVSARAAARGGGAKDAVSTRTGPDGSATAPTGPLGPWPPGDGPSAVPRGVGPGEGANASLGDDELGGRLEQLEGLLERGIITKGEFEQKRRELLADW